MDVQWISHRWVRWTLVIVAGLGLFGSGQPALAQDTGPVRLSTLDIALWPEFDRPEVLVIFQGRLADDVPLPAVLTLTMPREAGEPHAVAAVDEAGQRLNAPYDVQVQGDEARVTYTSLEHRAFQFEYYVDALQVKGNRRQFTFSYLLDAPVDDLVLELQQPSGGTNVALNPPAAETRSGFSDLTYHLLPLGVMDAGQRVEWQVSYQKSGSFLGFVIVGMALVLVLGSLWIVGSRRRAEEQQRASRRQVAKPPKPKKRRARKGTLPRSRSPSPAQSQPVRLSQSVLPVEPATSSAESFPQSGFCHQCGTSFKEDGLFCHRCGTRRKGT